MKRISLIAGIAMLCLGANAQYKKASFFQRGHKTYGFTAGMKMFSDGVKPAPNINFTYGNDKGRNRIFHWWDLDYTLGSTYSYTTTAAPSGTARVSGKAGGFLAMGYNWGIYLMDNKKDENKVLPFITLGMNSILAGRKYLGETITPSTSYPDKVTSVTGGLGFDAGAGVLYKSSERIGVFGNAGYRYVYTGSDESQLYRVMTSHPFVNVGIRILIKAED